VKNLLYHGQILTFVVRRRKSPLIYTSSPSAAPVAGRSLAGRASLSEPRPVTRYLRWSKLLLLDLPFTPESILYHLIVKDFGHISVSVQVVIHLFFDEVTYKLLNAYAIMSH